MEKIKLGLQIHALREAFAEDHADTLAKIAKMGYEGVELNYWTFQQEPEVYARSLKENGLECLGCMFLSRNFQDIDKIVHAGQVLGTDSAVISGLDAQRIREDAGYPPQAVEQMLAMQAKMKAVGIRTGYHSHDVDSKRLEDGRSFYEYVMDSTPSDFSMVIDTGNTMGGGDDPIALLKKYPGRTPVLHLKGYGKKDDYTTPVWDSEVDMEQLLTIALDECGTRTIIIEFGKRGDYEPFERAEKSLVWLRALLKKMGRL